MARGDVSHTKVHYKTDSGEDFVVMVDSVNDYQKWLGDKTVPLAHVVSSFKVFTTNRHGAQGILESAPRGILESEFGTANEDEAMQTILERGSVQEFEMAERQGRKNDANGSYATH
ncbi:ribosome maturation protein [Staphylotrichum tortipilum]|uniref:Ribosome maturation protein n=1 Tax=Staphylotrichum tortipilum TaxID=2831512 RepID=A0AAN6MGG6_9PEZI|nr:ribosome maturation protein [Staphylotrichum longicolle]